MAMSPKLLRPVASGFGPRQISGLLAWWDAQVDSSYNIETGVKEWRDLSGNGHTVTQSITNNQPTLSAINAKTAFLFDGSNDDLSASSVVLNATHASEFSIFGVTQVAAGEAGYVVGNVSVSPAAGLAVYAPVGNTYDIYYNGGAANPVLRSAGRANNVAQVWGVTHNNQTAQWSLNGSLSASATTSSTSNATSANLTIGNRAGGTSAATFFSGIIGSIVIYSRALSLSERSRVERWLGSRWGITVA